MAPSTPVVVYSPDTPWRGEPRCFSPPARLTPGRPKQDAVCVTAAADVGTPDPTLLPGGKRAGPKCDGLHGAQRPRQAAGFSYSDPVTQVKIWKVTSSTVPAANTGAGH